MAGAQARRRGLYHRVESLAAQVLAQDEKRAGALAQPGENPVPLLSPVLLPRTGRAHPEGRLRGGKLITGK